MRIGGNVGTDVGVDVDDGTMDGCGLGCCVVDTIGGELEEDVGAAVGIGVELELESMMAGVAEGGSGAQPGVEEEFGSSTHAPGLVLEETFLSMLHPGWSLLLGC